MKVRLRYGSGLLMPLSRWLRKIVLSIPILSGMLITTSLSAQVGDNVLKLDGVDDFVDVPALPWSGGGPITIEFWNFVASAEVQESTAFSFGTSDDQSIQAHAPWSDKVLYWDYGQGSSGRIQVNYAPYLDQWAHIALVSGGNGGTFKGIYINGNLVASIASSDGPDVAMNGLTIGRRNATMHSGVLSHHGKLDEFRVWNVVRSQAEIQASMSASLQGNEANLLAVFHFDAATGATTVGNASPSNFTGTLTNGASLVSSNNPPYVMNSLRLNPSAEVTAAKNVSFYVTFSEEVTGVDAADFTFTTSGSTTAGAPSVTAIDGTNYKVTVPVNGNGTVRLDIPSSASIADLDDIPFSETYINGQAYTIDQTTPPYTFVASLGTFIPLQGSNAVNALEGDNTAVMLIPIGFPFVFNGVTYHAVDASSNGYLTFKLSHSSMIGEVNDLTGTDIRPLLAPLWDDLDGSDGQASYAVTGEAPNRVFTFEWLNWRWNNQAAGAPGISFQVKLYEGTNVIEYIYRQESGQLLNPSASIGLGFQIDHSFLSLTNASATPEASTVTETTNINSKPASGQVYRFTGPPPVFSSMAPASDASINNTMISYNLSGNLASGTITWTHTGGTADPASPHVQALTGEELNMGAHERIVVANDPALVSGAIYTVTFSGTSADGRTVNEAASTNVTFDKTITNANLDTGFDPVDGTWGIRTMALTSDEKIIIGGELTSYNHVTRKYVARLNTDGSLDNTFDPGANLDGPVYSVFVQNDDKVMVAGAFLKYGGISRRGIARLNADGSLDETFNPGTAANRTVYSILRQNDGKILISGGFDTYNGVFANHIARLNADGTLDESFMFDGPGLTLRNIISMVLQPDGKIIVGAIVPGENGTLESRIIRLNSDGSWDESFNVHAMGSSEDSAIARKLALQPDGKALIAGYFYGYLIRVNSDGTLDETFEPEIWEEVKALLVQSDGKIIACGTSYIVLLNADGSFDDSFYADPGADGAISSILRQADGHILIGGDFYEYNHVPSPGIARIDPVSPVVTISDRLTPTAALTNVSSVTFHVRFSEPVTGVSANDFKVTADGVATGAVSVSKQNDDSFHVTVSSVAGNGTVRLDLHSNATLNDLAGNACNSDFATGQTYTIDQVAPVFSATAPATEATMIDTKVTYKLSEALASGSITWTRTGGAADANSPHVKALSGVELNAGDHPGITLANNPALVLGAIYSVSFSGADAAGNVAAEVTNTNIMYGKRSQTITFAAIDDKTVGNNPFAVTATSSSGLPVTLTASSGKITIANGQVTINTPGRVTITGSQSGSGDYHAAPSVERSFCIRPAKPVISASFADAGEPLLTSSASAGNQWYLGSTAITGAVQQTHVVTAAGAYKVQVTADDCMSEFSENFIVLITDIAAGAAEESIGVYPNPADDRLTVRGIQADAALSIIDATGRTRGVKAVTDGRLVVVDVSGLTTGVYLLQAEHAGRVRMIRFMKK